MAQRRMFSLKVIDTDIFLEMPISTRLLYYDLSMRADDDGFVDAPKKILKMVGCSEDDLKILFAKKYLIPFETGVCVIKHWNIHNLIRHDRYTETECKEEKSRIIKINGKYEYDNKNVIPNVNQLATQVRLGKVRLGKVRLGKDRLGEEEPQAATHIKKFIKPTISEIDEYMKSVALVQEGLAEKFYWFYESKGWLIGKAPMKSWQAAVQTWKKHQTNNIQPKYYKKGYDPNDPKQQEAMSRILRGENDN